MIAADLIRFPGMSCVSGGVWSGADGSDRPRLQAHRTPRRHRRFLQRVVVVVAVHPQRPVVRAQVHLAHTADRQHSKDLVRLELREILLVANEEPSALSQLDFRVDRSEFVSCVVDLHPVPRRRTGLRTPGPGPDDRPPIPLSRLGMPSPLGLTLLGRGYRRLRQSRFHEDPRPGKLHQVVADLVLYIGEVFREDVLVVLRVADVTAPVEVG